jgi:ankyrin repeat protein
MLHVACNRRVPTAIFTLLIESGANINAKNYRQQTPLHFLASSHDVRSIAKTRHILLRGASVEALDWIWNTPLHIACEYNNPAAASLMLLSLDSTNEVDALAWRNQRHDLPLGLMVKYWKESAVMDLGGPQGCIIMRMIEAGADPNDQKLLDNTTIATMQASTKTTLSGVYACIDFRLARGLDSIFIKTRLKVVVASVDMEESELPFNYNTPSKVADLLSDLIDSPFKFNDRPVDVLYAPTIVIHFAMANGEFFTTIKDAFSVPHIKQYTVVIKIPLDKCIHESDDWFLEQTVDKRSTLGHIIMKKASTNSAAAKALLPIMRAHCCPLMLSAQMLSPTEQAKKIIQLRFSAQFSLVPELFKLHEDYLKMYKFFKTSKRSHFKIISDDLIDKILNYVSPKLTKAFLIEAGYTSSKSVE